MEESHNSKEKKLVQNTMLYTISNFGSKIFTFLIVPLYTYYLSASEYGTYDTVYSMIGLITPMCILAVHEGLLRWLLKSDEDDSSIVYSGFTLYILFVAFTDVFLLFLFRFWKWEYSNLFILCLTTSTFNEVMQFSTRGVKRNVPFAVSGVIQTLVMLALNVLFVIILRVGIRGMLLSLAISQLTSSVYLLFSIKDVVTKNKYTFNKTLAKDMMLYSIMLVPNNISWWVMNSSDRIMLTAMIGSAFTGIYSIACKFPSLLNMIHMIFYRAWQEQAVMEYDSKTRDEYYTRIFGVYLRLGFCMILLLIPISKIYIMLFMNAEFKEAYNYLGILMLGSLFSSFSSFYGTGYVSAKDTKNATLTTTIGALVNCLINLLFIRAIGIWAACFSTLIGYLVTWVVRIKQTKKYFHIDVNWREFYILLSITLLFVYLVTLKDGLSAVLMLILAIFIAISVNRVLIHTVYDALITTVSKLLEK